MDLGIGGRVALVTGAASGIGAASARLLAAEGAQLVLADADDERVAELAAGLGEVAVSVAVDVRSVEDTRRMVATAQERFGRLDLAVNAAGVGVPQKRDVAETDVEAWRRIVGIDLDGVFLSMRAELPALLPHGGAIVNVASIMADSASAGASPYVAAKHGVVGLTRTAALEYAERGVRVNAIGPGFVDTPLLDHNTPEARAAMARLHPMNRLATVEEIARSIVLLLSPVSSFTTGAYLPVDGGYLAR
ncbi:SDR family NAD(P)-dependent oxidoreductase [Pseudonocardia halophobica]|uniref:SDR family NAD(P)-dependent oxidoreductase n=1 Tax=Pseudonocardia halophobica TaxID=29401 RepID=UPI003D90DE2C